MKVANIDSKTARTVSHEPINCTAKERRSGQIFRWSPSTCKCLPVYQISTF